MLPEDVDADVRRLTDLVLAEMKDWQEAHPRATLEEIEAAVAAQWSRVQAKVVEASVRARAAPSINAQPAAERPRCLECGHALQGRGRHRRRVQTTGNREISVDREYAACPACGAGLFPLDEALGLTPCHLSPRVQRQAVRLGALLPFAQAAAVLDDLTGTAVSPTTVRRLTEQAGRAYVAVQEAAVAAPALDALPPPAAPPQRLQLSVDGALVPLVGGTWEEVKTLVVGELDADGHAHALSYFSRLSDHLTFSRQAVVETHRRGVETAAVVCAVSDGAEWIQQFIDDHRPDAVRILDWAHVVGYLSKAAQAAWGAGTLRAAAWLDVRLHTLRYGAPEQVVAAVRRLLRLVQARGGSAEAQEVLTTTLGYLDKRVPHMRYAQYRAAGYPIGSGIAESGNRVAVQRRLKGPGMHWARGHIDPLVALTGVECNGRWAEAWPHVQQQERRQRRAARAQRRACRAASAPPPAVAPRLAAAPPAPRPVPPAARPGLPRRPRRPAADHPWRRLSIAHSRSA